MVGGTAEGLRINIRPADLRKASGKMRRPYVKESNHLIEDAHGAMHRRPLKFLGWQAEGGFKEFSILGILHLSCMPWVDLALCQMRPWQLLEVGFPTIQKASPVR